MTAFPVLTSFTGRGCADGDEGKTADNKRDNPERG